VTTTAGARSAALPSAAEVMSKLPGENFAVGSVLLGSHRAHLQALYGFARLVDDVGDESAGDRLALLDAVEDELDRAFAGTARHPVFRRLEATIAERALPVAPFRRLIEANRLDQRVRGWQSWAELLGYCDLSANPVGELVLHVFGAAGAENVRLSDRICTALQVVEHLQDVRDDSGRGRVYLPAEDMARFGVRREDLDARSAPLALRRLVAFELGRVRALLDEGAPLVRRLHGRPRLAVAGYLAGGRAAVAAVERGGCDVLQARLRASGARRGLETVRVLVGA
jgi:squalene synthase HpnC